MNARSLDPIRRLVYCFSSGISPSQEEANAGLEEVPGLLEEARRQGIDVEEVDLSMCDEEKRRALYEQAAAAAVRSRCRIRELFGSRRRGYGPHFGREAPALLVYRGEERIPAEVYPCRRRGRVMSIRDFLKGLPEAERSFKPIRREDLARLAEIARGALEDFIRRRPRWAPYRERLAAIALCQGAACHYLDGRTGVKDFDVWLFFSEIPGQPFPYRWHSRYDFGPSRFGRTPGFWGLGRRVDVLGRSLKISPDEDPARAISGYLKAGKEPTPRHLREKAVILLDPPERLGEIVWEGRCGSGQQPGDLSGHPYGEAQE
jgi:hypothetical protein